MKFVFVTDIHGNERVFRQLFNSAEELRADAVVFGGDLLPCPASVSTFTAGHRKFITYVLRPLLEDFKKRSRAEIYLMLGNDDAAGCADDLQILELDGLAKYINMRIHDFGDFYIYGYSFVPLTPFGIKDWDKFDTHDQEPPGTFYPPFFTQAAGVRQVDFEKDIRSRGTIEDDFIKAASETDPSRTVYVTHSPPYNTALDIVYSAEHVGSRSIRRFIEEAQPPLTLHGHIHESPAISGRIFDKTGHTISINPGASSAKLNALVLDTEDIVGRLKKLVRY
jgi:Icc-related predicted phosphoesterase